MSKFIFVGTHAEATETGALAPCDEVLLTKEEQGAPQNAHLIREGLLVEQKQKPQTPPVFDRAAAIERLTELEVEFKGNASNDTLAELLEAHEKPNESIVSDPAGANAGAAEQKDGDDQ